MDRWAKNRDPLCSFLFPNPELSQENLAIMLGQERVMFKNWQKWDTVMNLWIMKMSNIQNKCEQADEISSKNNTCNLLMRRSNCFAPIPPGQPRDQRKNLCDKKGRGTRKWSEKRAGHSKMKGLKWLIRAGQGRNKVIKRPGHPQKTWCPRECPGGWGQNNLTGALLRKMTARHYVAESSNNWIDYSKLLIQLEVEIGERKPNIMYVRFCRIIPEHSG